MSDFSRTLALLRREKKISQRAAAGDLGVSQALLSHYENGLREPGLSFVVRAADYYGVSCDYLLGRSMARDGSAVPAERMEGTTTETEHSPIVQAAALLLQVAESLESKQLSHEIESYFAVAIYKVYRYLYMADPSGVEAVFRAGREEFEYLCDARMKQQIVQMRAMEAPLKLIRGLSRWQVFVKLYARGPSDGVLDFMARLESERAQDKSDVNVVLEISPASIL